MGRLSSPIQEIRDHYTAVVVGSGYGGGVAASRLARAGQQVCVLERGKEFQPGEYPDGDLETLAETQTNLPAAHVGSRTGLYDYHLNPDLTVLVGCGLGGTSLINANVALRPDERIFDDGRWPQAFRDDVNQLLAVSYSRAEAMLKPVTYPRDFPELPKLRALQKSAVAMRARYYRLPINVTFEDGLNHVGVPQFACKLCGDCVSGCNHGAKNTTLMNYLPDARNHGAEIFTQVSVRRIERRGNRWLIHYQALGTGQERFDAPTATVSADILILAAGTLGTNEILLRSKAAGLPLSDKIGHAFSGNGDVGGIAYNADQVVNAVGIGARPPGSVPPVGPTITGVIDLRDHSNPNQGIIIEEGSLSGSLAVLLPRLLANAARLGGIDTDAGIADAIAEKKRELESLALGAYHGAVNHTQVFLVMTHDDSNGRLALENDRIRIRWPGYGKQPFVRRVNDLLLMATRAIGGTFIENPIWGRLPTQTMVTAHPLGGCIMAEHAADGVVNHKGQVFAGAGGTAVYEDLYVCDGSVMPRSLGANPLLTITAVAERCCHLLIKERGWDLSYQFDRLPERPVSRRPLGIQFSETMGGYFSTNVKDDFALGFRQGQEEKSPFRFILTILAEDLEQMMADPNYSASLTGTVTAPALSPEPLTVTRGEFNLFTYDPGRVGARLMKYRMKMSATDGRSYYFYGYKVAYDDPGLDLWRDTTTLYITVYDGDNMDCPILGRGILRIYANDFRRQIATVQIKNAESRRERLGATARFGRFFAGELFDIYGGVFSRPGLFDPDAPPRKKRELRVEAPEVHYFRTADGAKLRLTRYRGGDKGPVMLVHGLGVSSLAFAIDTIDTNLLEYLFAHGYDVWLLDYRSSIELPLATTQYTADDVARYDYPAAVAKIQAESGAATIQVVGHCYGAITFHMAMLAGLQGVRSAVSSQVGAHIKVIPANRVKSGLYLDALLKKIGVESLTMYTDINADRLNRLYNNAVRLNPVIRRDQRCSSPVCHRVTFLYAPLYEHSRLNTATHDALHELFGVASISNFRHLGVLTRRGQLVTAGGENSYMDQVKRLAIPITYIHGAENKTWLPKSTELTYNWLRRHNGHELYRRHEIPSYGHIDCIFGKDAVTDVYPLILDHLEETAQV
jgi:cholesterol oxidase